MHRFILIAKALVWRDIKCAWLHKSQLLQPLLFYLIVMTLFPLAVGHHERLLSLIGPGIAWVAALLASLLSLEHLFVHDYQDGSLELLLLSPEPLTGLMFVKVITHWLLTGLPLILITPLMALFLHMSTLQWHYLILSLLIGTPILSFVGAIGSALTVALSGSGILLALLMLPLYVPVLIFGDGMVYAAVQGLPIGGLLAILGAILALCVALAPYATASALRISSEV